MKRTKKSGYSICDNLALFFYKYIFRYSSQMNIMESNIFYDRYIKDDFEQQHVPYIFENICKQYLIQLNRKGKLEELSKKQENITMIILSIKQMENLMLSH